MSSFSIFSTLVVYLLLFVLSVGASAQGFLEMPDTMEVPEYESESMLLDLDVPPVRDRDPDPEAGPRLNVKEFRLQGLVEYPKLGITRKGLIERVESIRFDLMSEGTLTDSGYTLDELGEVSDLIAEIEKASAEEHVGPLEVQKLVFLIRDQRRRRGVTLGMIETVADTITLYYREKGFILAKAYIPEQKVRDGVVTLTLLLGELGGVNVENNRRVSSKRIENIFKKDLNRPVASWKIEESLYLVNDIPGLSAQGFFQAGEQVGDTLLSVNVLSEDWYTVNTRLDNHGSDTTGEYRAYLDFALHNPLGYGDELQLSVLNSFNPENTTFGAIRYNAHIGTPRWRSSIGVSKNDFKSESLVSFGGGDDVDSSSLKFLGESTVSDVSLSYHLRRSRVKNYSTTFSIMDIATVFKVIQGDNDSGNTEENDVLNTAIGFNFDVLAQKSRRLHVGRITLTHTDNVPLIPEDISEEENSTESQQDRNPTGNAFFLSYEYSMLSFINVPFTEVESRLVLTSSGQFVGKAMTNVNQFSMTGPTRARGFEVNTGLFDDAVFFSADWVFKAPKFGGATFFGKPLDRIVQPYIFVDLGYGVIHPLVEGDVSLKGKLGSVGFGLKLDFANFKSNIVISAPVLDDVDAVEEDTEASGLYFEMQYSF